VSATANSPTPRPRRSQGRDIHEAHRVATPLELLFDLVFVVAIAQAAAQLHHGIAAHHTLSAIGGFVVAFGAIWWAWMNYTWFASAYDDNSPTFRVLTMVQMVGVLGLAAGVPGFFEGKFNAGVAGYVVMRLALCLQWVRAARGHPECRVTCMRYAQGIAAVQVGWLLFLAATQTGVLAGAAMWTFFVLLWVGELGVPMWAERANPTPWHAHHIAERYGLLVIIVLGEGILGASNAVAAVWASLDWAWSFDVTLVGFGCMLLVFCLWWMYFLVPSADALHHHRERSFVWGYGHFVLFAAVAAVGACLEVVADTLKALHSTAGHGAEAAVGAAAEAAHGVSATYAIASVAVAEGIYVIALWALYRYISRAQHSDWFIPLVCLACIALAPLAVSWGVPLQWGLLLLSSGPIIAIAYHEYGHRFRTEQFTVR
jgi:low temperature requirement protein LtrA